ncbi:MAG: hypothetical protein ACTJGE_12005 [Corynebacterium variabile]|uniref:hypothetical protein n=1 Tax=Corynebacterium variabile TaxID=1727 RepID=UPI002595E5EC|nr:hypothetical protein [uncultured Corynebacterium sp.]
MKNVRRALLAAATATAVTLSGTAVASAEGNTAVTSAQSQVQATAEGGTGTGIPAKDTSGSSDFGDVFGSSVTDEETGESSFQFAQALKALKNVAAFGTAVAAVLGVIVTLSTKIPEVLEIFGIDTPSKK